MAHWWVNQNQTYAYEVGGGYMWSPKTNSGGHRNRFYDAMTETRPGDVVFSFCDTQIKAVGIVRGPFGSAPKPTEFGAAGSQWSNEGWYVPVHFVQLKAPIRPKDHMEVLGPLLPPMYSPLQANGNGNQGVYLAPVPEPMAATLRHLLGHQVEAAEAQSILDEDPDADSEQERIDTDSRIPETEKLQLIRARIGQGLFRSRVELKGPACRITGITDRRFLRASHIKPWAKSDNREKIDGDNGLMLAPHIDHLFDNGFISFLDDGSLMISPQLPNDVVIALRIAPGHLSIALNPNQVSYMAFHRQYVFKQS